MRTTLRPSRALFRFSGDDAQKLLFDVVTGRLVAEGGTALWWALLSPQGKIQAEGLSTFEDDAFWLDVDTGVADAFFKRMRMYKLRAAVEIADLRQTHAVGWAGGAAHTRVIGTKVESVQWDAADSSYDAVRIAHGIAELGPDFAPDQMFPHDIGMDLLGGVDFKKGCYIGQEVVSRMEHRGTARRRPVIVSGIDAPSGSAVIAGGRDAGSIGQVVGGRAVAVVRLDRFSGGEVAVGGKPATVTLPEWATYRLRRIGACRLAFPLSGEDIMARGKDRAWQRMLSGRRLDILDPSPVDVELSDIAHGLARVARWNGQTQGDYPFSVAQHSVLVLDIFSAHAPGADNRAKLYALLHDAPEYVMGDIISPFKAAMGGNYKEVENRLLAAVHLHFALNAAAPVAIQKQIKRADKEAAYHEAVHLAGFAVEEARKFFGEPSLAAFDLEHFDELIRPWPTRQAHDRFVDAVDMLATPIHTQS